MKLPTSSKTGSGGKRPHIKKGYYPGQLLKIEEYRDKDKNWVDGKWGRMLIFSFAIFKSDSDGKPTFHMAYAPDEKAPKELKDVEISAFLYHLNIDKNDESGFRTAITPNSKITKVLKCLGWEFSAEGIDTDKLIGNFIELNIDDYDQKDGDETYKASTIAGFNKYEGPAIPKDLKTPSTPENKDVKKQMKHEDTKKEEPKELTETQKKKQELLKLRNEGLLTQEGYDAAIEQLDSTK